MSKTVCIIGAGIHGMTSAVELAEAGFKVCVIDKNEDILQGTSGSTHNRAHIGYHYPRSIETAKECFDGLQYFKEKYTKALSYPAEVYYLISKDSKTTVESFKQFCDSQKYPYKITLPSDEYLIKDNIENGFKVIEPVFNIFKLKEIFKEKVQNLNINIFLKSIITKLIPHENYYEVIIYNGGVKTVISCDYIINATYAYSNNVLKILDLEEDMTEYTLQYTEVAVLKTNKYVPSLTVMDGPYVSLMPYANQESNLYLLYDVINSVVEKYIGYFFEDKQIISNKDNMIKHCKEYFPFQLQYICSLYGSRPIPISPSENSGDCRKTRIKCHEKHPGIYSILEGKFISAPLVAKNIVDILKK